MRFVGLPQVDGKVTYNGHGFDEFVVPRTAAYVDQNSNHIAELTVRETLDFAQRVQGVDYSAQTLTHDHFITCNLWSLPCTGRTLNHPNPQFRCTPSLKILDLNPES